MFLSFDAPVVYIRKYGNQRKEITTVHTPRHNNKSRGAADTARSRARIYNFSIERHIRLLHEYNEIKDVGQGLMGIIADARGVRQVDVEKEFGVGEKD
ncbi:DNA repair protein Swi5/Sae3 [Penicillium soppii]|uniref:DNA repair protein Swi5/Sae3 n=1 Tax=Penicillium soppii TaxID=69789 RepID=UPI002547066A|nr:DNA repair protein Swi5/Sae3 [Penicillium soppii]KAJ5872249.1 DNA repair protein Swi5/Sae3 [Penicillium soppii]